MPVRTTAEELRLAVQDPSRDSERGDEEAVLEALSSPRRPREDSDDSSSADLSLLRDLEDSLHIPSGMPASRESEPASVSTSLLASLFSTSPFSTPSLIEENRDEAGPPTPSDTEPVRPHSPGRAVETALTGGVLDIDLSDSQTSLPMAHANPPMMPFSGERGAPSYKGDPDELQRFLDHVREVGARHGVRGEDLIPWAVQYADVQSGELWDLSWDEFKADQAARNLAIADAWAAFTKVVEGLYPGKGSSRQHTIGELEDIVIGRAKEPIRTREELGEYHRAFLRKSTYLIQRGATAKATIGNLFIQGITGELRDLMFDRLKLTHIDHITGDPFSVQEIMDALNFVLAGTMNAGGTSLTSISSTCVAVPQVKAEPSQHAQGMELAMGFAQGLMQSLPALLAQQNPPRNFGGGYGGGYGGNSGPGYGGSGGGGQGYGGGYGNVSGGRMGGGGMGDGRCRFCGKTGHFIRACPDVEGYVRAGKATRVEGQIALPNGQFPPRDFAQPDAPLKDRFDAWLRDNPRPADNRDRQTPPHQAVGINLIQMIPQTPTIMLNSARIEEVDEEEERAAEQLERAQVMLKEAERKVAKEAEKKGMKRGRFEAVEVPRLADLRKERSGPPGERAAGRTEEAVAKADGGDGAQYKYQAPVEELTINKGLLDKLMGASITLTARELLSVAPDVRRKMKDLTTTRRIATNMQEAEGFFTLLDQKEKAVAGGQQGEPMMGLRTVEAIINDKVKCEAILDSGSQVVMMSMELLEAIEAPLRTDRCMMMEAANAQKTLTRGMVKSLKVTVGGIEFVLSAQVSDSVPFDLLLGRPFHALANLVTRDFDNGNQDITLTKPGTTERTSIRTRERTAIVAKTGF